MLLHPKAERLKGLNYNDQWSLFMVSLLNFDPYQMENKLRVPFKIVPHSRDANASDSQILRLKQFQASKLITNL